MCHPFLLIQTPQEESKLHCWYEYKRHTFLYLNPQKVELLHTNPNVWQIHDFVRDQTINAILFEAKQNVVMSRSSCGGSNDKNVISEQRTSMSARIERMVPQLETFNRNIEILTGLKVRKIASEPMKVLNYSPLGSHFLPHFDPVIIIVKLNPISMGLCEQVINVLFEFTTDRF